MIDDREELSVSDSMLGKNEELFLLLPLAFSFSLCSESLEAMDEDDIAAFFRYGVVFVDPNYEDMSAYPL